LREGERERGRGRGRSSIDMYNNDGGKKFMKQTVALKCATVDLAGYCRPFELVNISAGKDSIVA
jgi:hypothetical protein